MARRRKSGFSVTLGGVRVTVQELTKWSSELRRKVKTQTIKEANQALSLAKSGPFKNQTGNLRGGMRVQYFEDSDTAVVSTNQPYAAIVNWGFDRRFQFMDSKKLKAKFRRNIRRVVKEHLK